MTIPGIITLVYPEKQEIYLGYFNMSIGIGTCAGPVLGSLIYEFFGYGMTFICFAVLIFISFIISMIILPNKLNYTVTRSISMELRGEKHEEISYLMFLTNKNIVLLILTTIFAMIF